MTLPHILERTRDVDEHVRRAAYKFLAEKVHIKSLTISQREGVLKRGLGDRNEVVRKVVEKEMIPAWLRLSNNNIVQQLSVVSRHADQELLTWHKLLLEAIEKEDYLEAYQNDLQQDSEEHEDSKNEEVDTEETKSQEITKEMIINNDVAVAK